MSKEHYIGMRYREHLFEWSRISFLSGALFLIAPILLDYYAVPGHFVRFLMYRLIALGILSILYIINSLKIDEVHQSIIATVATSSVAVMLSAMILRFHGHESPYTLGFIVLIIFACGFVPLKLWASLVISGAIYGIYVVPLLLFDRITNMPFFLSMNFLMLSCIAALVLLRCISHKRLIHEFGLQYDVDRHQQSLEALIRERTEQLSRSITMLEHEIHERKRIEQSLRESELRLRTLTANAPDVIVELDRSGRIHYISRVLDGYQLSDVVGQDFCAWAPAEYHAIMRSSLEQAIITGAPQEYEARGYGTSGTMRWYLVRLAPVPVSDGIERVILVARDITERKYTEELLHINEERLRLAMYATKQGWYELNMQTGEVTVSEEYPRILGYEPEEFRTNISEWTKALHPDDREAVLRVFRDVFESGTAGSMEYRRRMKSGAWKWLRSTGIVIAFDNNRPLRMIGTHADISEQKEAEEALRKAKHAAEQSKAWYEQVVSMISDVVWRYEVDPQMNLISSYISPVGERIIGLPAGALGNDFEKFFAHIHADDLPSVQQALLQGLVNRSQGASIDYQLLRSDGTIRWVRSKGSAHVQPDGNIVGFGTTIDITELKETEAALRAAKEHLEADVVERTAALMAANERLRSLSVHLQNAREQERSRIAREIHDELGQSLTAIRLELPLLRQEMSVDSRDAAARALSIERLLESTMNSVKRISRDLRPAILDHLGLTAAIEWQAEEFERRTGISCSVSFEPASIALDNERSTAVFRIFQETLTNVAKHASASMIDARLRTEDNVLTLQVVDNGRGMKEEQIDDAHSFGLVGIRERVLVWGGKLTISGREGRGTAVIVQIPLEWKGIPS